VTEDSELAERVKNGHEANSIINNPMFKGAMLSAKGALINRFVDSEFKETEKREEVWLRLKAMEDFFQELTDIIQTGKLAQTDLENRSKHS
jgi:hypothetical protein